MRDKCVFYCRSRNDALILLKNTDIDVEDYDFANKIGIDEEASEKAEPAKLIPYPYHHERNVSLGDFSTHDMRLPDLTNASITEMPLLSNNPQVKSIWQKGVINNSQGFQKDLSRNDDEFSFRP